MGSILRAVTLVSLTACGSVVGPAQPDAAPKPIDADLNDADLTGTVTVITKTHNPGGGAVGAAQPDVDLVAIRPNGSVGDMTMSDATGNATIHVYPGGSVTAVYHHALDMGADLVTFMGVKPGDTLNFGKQFGPATSNLLGSMTLSWPANAAATSYNVYFPCGGYGFGSATTTYPSFTEYDSCDHTPMFVIGVAFNGTGQVIGYSTTNVTFQSGGSATLSGWQTPGTASLNVSGVPAEINNLNGAFYNIANGGRQEFGFGVNGQPTGGAFSQNFMWGPAGERTYGDLSMRRQGSFSAIHVLDAIQTNTLSWTIAMPQLPPWHAGTIVSAAARMVVWFPIGPTTHDGDVVMTNWSHVVNTVNTPFSWSFVVPPTVTAINFPELPAAFTDFMPHPEDPMGAQVQLVDIPTVANYDAFRALPERQLVCLDCAVRAGEIQRVIRTD